MKKQNKKDTKNLIKIILVVAITAILAILGISHEEVEKIFADPTAILNDQISENSSNDNNSGIVENSNFDKVTIETGNSVIKKIENQNGSKIYFFDVGQADSILIVKNRNYIKPFYIQKI